MEASSSEMASLTIPNVPAINEAFPSSSAVNLSQNIDKLSISNNLDQASITDNNQVSRVH